MRKYIDILIFTSCLKNVREYSLVQKKKKDLKIYIIGLIFPSQLKLLGKEQQFLARSVQVK